ncbi:recombinase RecB [Nostoc sp.]|uniref:recombinase RecB n=1 Tax=Nostoc sp. TaxID=1180 RepID=UPI002FFB6536
MLRKTEQGWMFAQEYLLEDFIWDCLESALDLIPLKRQFSIKGEYCDILAKTKNNQLAVLELKNCEDRYIIHQLTRYYHSLSLEQPLKELIDYSLPIRLIAIAPDFHKHNFIDRRYNLLQFEFIRFSIISHTNNFYLHLYLEGRKEIIVSKPIPFLEIQETQELLMPANPVELPPRMLVNFLDKLAPVTKTEVLRLREKMLCYDQRIREIKEIKSIFYGRGRTKPCCQLKFIASTKLEQLNHLQCYLWLPIPKSRLRFNKKAGIGRMYLNCDPDFRTVKTITYWTETNRYASDLPMSIDLYLDELGLDQANQNIDRLFDLALKLNLERN